MAGNLHLVGEFPAWTVERVLTCVEETLGSLVRFFPADALQNVEGAGNELLRCHQRFSALKEAGRIPADARLQLNLPAGAEPAKVLASALQVIPSSELAVQVIYPLWRNAATSGAGDGDDFSVAKAATELADTISDLPQDCAVAVHFCCRDGASYAMSSDDLEAMVAISNALVARLDRSIDVLHFPVPLRHEDDRYFRGLSALDERARTALCLGLIHLSDGVAGALARMALARPYADTFTLAARCGFSKRHDAEIAPFLALHGEVLRSVDGEHRKDDL